MTLKLEYEADPTEIITAVIVDQITGDPIPFAPWDTSDESARNADQKARDELWNLIPPSDRQDANAHKNTMTSMMRHRAEMDGAHLRITKTMNDGSYKTVFYDEKLNPLWEVMTQAPNVATAHLEINPAQEGGAGEMAEASVAEVAGTESTQRPSKGDDSEEEKDEDDSAEESTDEEEDNEAVEEDDAPPKVVVKPSKARRPKVAPKLEQAMNREKVKKGDFLKKRREEEEKKKKSGDESESKSTGKKREERKKKDKPSSPDVEILNESVTEVGERSSTPTTSKKLIIESATSKSKVTEDEPPKHKGKTIAIKQVVPVIISASTLKERKEKGKREKPKRETSRESEASEVSLPSTSTVSTRSHTDSKPTRSRTTEPRSLAEVLEKGKKAKSEPVKTKRKGKAPMKIDALAIANYIEPDGESELDYSGDEAEFEDPDSDNMTTIDEIIDAFDGAEKNFTRIRTTSVTSKFRTGLKKYLRKEKHRSFTKQKFDVVLEFALNAGKLIQKHPNFAYNAKLFRPSSSDKALTTPNEDTAMRIERAIAGMTSPLGSTSHRISQYINAVWNDGKGMIKEIDTATERVLPRMIKQNVLATTNAHRGYPIRYTRVGLIPPEKQTHCHMSDSQEMEKAPSSGDPSTPILNLIAQKTAEEAAAGVKSQTSRRSKARGPMDEESEESDDDTTTQTPLEPAEKDDQPKGQGTSGTVTEAQTKGHETSQKGAKEKIMLPMEKAAAEAEAAAAAARQVFQRSLFAPLKDVFEKERSKSAGELGGHETLPQEEKTAEPKSAQSSSGSLAKLTIDDKRSQETDSTDSAQSPQKTEIKEATDYSLGAPLDVNNRTWNEVQAALQIIREKEMLDAIGGTNGASWGDLSNFMAVHYELGELNIENDKEWIKNAVEALISDEVLHIKQDGRVDFKPYQPPAKEFKTEEMAQKGQASSKSSASEIDRSTGYNPKCPDCLRNNKKVDKKFPCYTCIHKLGDPHIVSLVGIMEAKRGNLDVFRNLISARNYGSIPVEERMLLEDRYREAIQNNESGWDETLESLKCPQTDAYRKKFEEDREKMRVQKMEDELRAKINAENKRLSEQAARETSTSSSSSAVPTASLNDDEAQLIRQSLIIQIDTLTKDPAAMPQDLFDMLLREKLRLQKGFAPAPYIKKAVEERMEELRRSRQTESNVLQALRSFKRDEGFIRPRSPPHRERSRGHSREHERTSGRRNERSREHSRERTRDYRSERSRERSRDQDYRGGRGWVRHGNEITETSIQRKIDTAKILAATRGREEQRRAETFRTEPEKEGHQVPLEVPFRNRNVRMSTPERSWDKRRERTRNRTPDPRDKRWQERDKYYAGFESGASKRSSSAEREDTPPKHQRMESTVHVVDPIISTVQEDDLMEGTSSIAEASQENVTHRRNVILDSDLQPALSASNEPPQRELDERREQEAQREADDRRVNEQRKTSRFNNRHPESVDMEYNMNDTDEQKVEICRYFGIEGDSAEANKIHTALNQLRQFLFDSGYAKEIKEGVEQGTFRRLYIPRDSIRDCYLPIRRNGLHSLVDLNLLDVPLDTTDPIGMTQFYYRDYPERQEYVAQFVLRYVNPAFKLLAARASIGLQVDPKDYAAR
ncbi:uncharacterized protein LOC129584080 [Paramacrobiotus metropolitanus]|uniref:uncharacterized protein LOC129584080 n=1 Tax=Paramacrobiotus metropolitanus TaxID=2943436 RepID=UPI0024462634|nr:uncharacterized protein LOC129584080 [Paramacrobiotus metropolitanus]